MGGCGLRHRSGERPSHSYGILTRSATVVPYCTVYIPGSLVLLSKFDDYTYRTTTLRDDDDDDADAGEAGVCPSHRICVLQYPGL